MLWTRLAPEPLVEQPGHARRHDAAADVTVGYEIATDPAMREIVRRGEATAEQALRLFGASRCARPAARPALLVSLHQRRRREPRRARGDVAGAGCRARAAALRLRLLLAITSTAISPPTGISPTKTRISCSSSATTSTKPSSSGGRPCAATRDGIEAATLPTYRNRYAQYRLDPDLQRLHAEVPALMTWDDHEVQNDYADKWSETFDDPRDVPVAAGGGLSGVLRAHAAAADPVAARTGR